MSVLEKIEAKVRERIEEDREKISLGDLESQISRRPQDFRNAFRSPGPRVIAEVKLASPSEGDIALGMDAAAVARDYLTNGAAALSVLTERDFFKGHPEYLVRIRRENPQAFLLMKDFVVDEYQLYQGLVHGADAVLFIVALLGAERTRELLFKSLELGLSPLVEVHNEEEMRVAVDVGASLVGVNNRDLKTLEISLETSERLARLAPAGTVLIAESGLRSGAELKHLGGFGYRGFLIGTSFMKSGTPGRALAKLLKEAS